MPGEVMPHANLGTMTMDDPNVFFSFRKNYYLYAWEVMPMLVKFYEEAKSCDDGIG